MPIRTLLSLPLALTLCFSLDAHAASSTSDGRISVQQVIEMLDRAPTDPVANQLLTAYLAGVGETAASMLQFAAHTPLGVCEGRMQLSANEVRKALDAGAGVRADWTDTAATPVLLDDMLRRANCRLVK